MISLVKQKNKYGHIYLSLRESYWDPIRKKTTSRTVQNFGRLDELLKADPNTLDKLEAYAASLRNAVRKEKGQETQH